MKAVIYLGAAVALLRSVAAFLHNDQQDIHNQLRFQPGNGENQALNDPSPFTEPIPAERFPTQPPNTSPPSPDSPPPPNSNFTLGSPTSRLWAITYTPYTTTQTCLPPPTIRADIASIAAKGFTAIRLYSTDCSALSHIAPAAHRHSLTLILGVPLDDGPASATAQITDIIAWATAADPTTNPPTTKWPLIALLVIGNEALFNAHATAPALRALIHTSRLRLRAASYAGPITTTEPLALLAQHARLLCPVLDVVASNIHPFFHPAVSADMAGGYVAGQLKLLGGVCDGVPSSSSSQEQPLPKLQAINLETGWPSRGIANGLAVPGVLEQRVAVRGIVEGSGGRSVLLGYGDEGWREGGQFGVEGSWGCGGIFGEGEGEGVLGG